jgi:hypothetical protein
MLDDGKKNVVEGLRAHSRGKVSEKNVLVRSRLGNAKVRQEFS